MSNNDNYKATIRPRPELIEGKVYWGWDVMLTDKSDDKTYDFGGAAGHEDADSALRDGGKAMLLWMQALSVVADKGISEINLDAPIPVDEPLPATEQAPEENPEAEENPAEETPEAEKPGAEAAAE